MPDADLEQVLFALSTAQGQLSTVQLTLYPTLIDDVRQQDTAATAAAAAGGGGGAPEASQAQQQLLLDATAAPVTVSIQDAKCWEVRPSAGIQPWPCNLNPFVRSSSYAAGCCER
jgi:hypothetical protein